MRINWLEVCAERAKSGHALFGGSAMPRIVECPGSVSLCVRNNRLSSKDTEHTRLGKFAHSLGERCFNFHVDADYFIGMDYHCLQIGGNIIDKITSEMAKYVQEYVDWCRDLKGDHFVENRLSLGRWSPIAHQFGTSDHAAIYRRTLVITDLKYGMELVDVHNNIQLIYYVLCFLEEYEGIYQIDKVVIRIAQPRLGYFDEQEFTVREIYEFGEIISRAIQEAMGDYPSFRAGEKQCRWCPMSGRCEVQKRYVDKIRAKEFESIDDEMWEAEALTIEELEETHKHMAFVRQWMRDTHRQLMTAVMAGESKKLKIIESRKGNRQYKEPLKAAKFYLKHGLTKGQIYETSLISPAQGEKLLPKPVKEGINSYCNRAPGKPMIVPVSDKRPAYQPVMAELEEFEDEEDDDGLGE